MHSETMETLQEIYKDTRKLMRKHYGDLPNLTIRTHITGYSKNPNDVSAWRPCVTLDAYRNVDGKMDRSFKISGTGSTWELAIAKLAGSVVEHFRDMEESYTTSTPFKWIYTAPDVGEGTELSPSLTDQDVGEGTELSPSITVGQFAAIAERLENSLLGIHARLDKLEQGSETEEGHDS